MLRSGYCYYLSDTGLYTNNSYQGAIRQDTVQKKIYYCVGTSPNETILYDFNLHLGDTLHNSYNNGSDSNYVSSIDSILIGTTFRKQYHISTGHMAGNDTNYVQLIEGIGSTYGLAFPITPPFEWGSKLNCFSQNNVTIYPNTTGICYLRLGIKEQKESTPNDLATLLANGGKFLGTAVRGKFISNFPNGKGKEIFYIAVYVDKKTLKPVRQSVVADAMVN